MPTGRPVLVQMRKGHGSMITFGVDAHKRTHTIVAVDDRGTPLGQITVGTTSHDHLGLLGGLPGSARSAVGRWRTAVTFLADSSGICSRQENASFGCRRS
jgi:hypothetical protein